MIIFVLLILLVILINLLVLFLIKENEKKQCECSKLLGWKRTFIKNYTILSLALITIIYILPIILLILRQKSLGSKFSKFVQSPFISLFLSAYLGIGFFNIYYIFKYTKELETSKCACMLDEDNILQNTIRKWLHYYSILVILIYIITTLVCYSFKLK